jgi:hypothetical protein
MPKVKYATVTLRDGTILREGHDHIEYGPQLLSTFAVEMQSKPVERKSKWWHWNKTVVQVQEQARVPIKSWPYSQVTRIDWGYMAVEEYNALKKIVADQKAKERANAKPGTEPEPKSDGQSD